jgi:hypothetical protein
VGGLEFPGFAHVEQNGFLWRGESRLQVVNGDFKVHATAPSVLIL